LTQILEEHKDSFESDENEIGCQDSSRSKAVNP
jgi:hypothetical protein